MICKIISVQSTKHQCEAINTPSLLCNYSRTKINRLLFKWYGTELSYLIVFPDSIFYTTDYIKNLSTIPEYYFPCVCTLPDQYSFSPPNIKTWCSMKNNSGLFYCSGCALIFKRPLQVRYPLVKLFNSQLYGFYTQDMLRL